MVTGKLRKSGNSFIVTVPRDEVERLGLEEGQLVTVEVHPVEVRPVLTVRQGSDSLPRCAPSLLQTLRAPPEP